MIEALSNLEAVVEGLLSREKNPTPERIRELIHQSRLMPMCTVDDSVAEKLAREFEKRHGVTMELGTVLTEHGYEPWLEAAQAQIEPYYWKRYRRLLVEQGWSSQVLATQDNVTDRILGLLENPTKPGCWDRRGMVLGHVQSGKTANYIGLVSKAADAGYKLIVIIAGIHNNLRNQTQIRVDEGFVGRDSARLLLKKSDRFVGVGRFDQTRRPVTFTNSLRDFSKNMATSMGVPLQNLNEPAVFVIKKNSSTLRNLIEWLSEHSTGRDEESIDAPMLLIDDEADNASINIKHGKGEVSKINGQIRGLLKMFKRSCYVGYTATPFANIFIDPDTEDEMIGDDLFPRHFIVSLDPPSNYFGPNRVFLKDSTEIIRHISDNEDVLPLKHKKETEVVVLPQSLLKAIRGFVLARAVRLLRGHRNKHCSMLVNASRFIDVQRQIRNEVHSALSVIQSSARINGALPLEFAVKDPELAAMHDVWQEEYSSTEHQWADILPLLHEAAAPIVVVEVNSRSSGTLNYKDYEKTGLSVIAVGGFSLSRGLTLEGLMVSYFLRNSMMYDTLMQMGRWFGYRTEYDDLCRVWMPEEAEGWYSHIAESIELLRHELRAMEAAGATPEEFGLKVRSHPDALIVTARNKMGSGEKLVVNIGLANEFIETATLRRDRGSIATNRRAVDVLCKKMSAASRTVASANRVPGGYLVREVPASAVLSFLSSFKNHPASMLTDPGPVSRYIKERQAGELRNWDVLFASLDRPSKDGFVDRSLGIEINCQQRTAGSRSDETTLKISNKQRVASRGIEKIGLTPDEVRDAERVIAEAKGLSDEQAKRYNYPDHAYRKKRRCPLLIIHLLTVRTSSERERPLEPVVAWSISFPQTQLAEKRVEYVVNTTWMREHFGDDVDDDELGGDDA